MKYKPHFQIEWRFPGTPWRALSTRRDHRRIERFADVQAARVQELGLRATCGRRLLTRIVEVFR